VQWEDLPGGLRQANRSQADHVPTKQRTRELSSSDRTIEALAIQSIRDRWLRKPLLAGGTFRIVTPPGAFIRPYDQLSDEEKQKDRNTASAATPQA